MTSTALPPNPGSPEAKYFTPVSTHDPPHHSIYRRNRIPHEVLTPP